VLKTENIRSVKKQRRRDHTLGGCGCLEGGGHMSKHLSWKWEAVWIQWGKGEEDVKGGGIGKGPWDTSIPGPVWVSGLVTWSSYGW